MRPTEVTVLFRRSRQPQQYESAEASVAVKYTSQDGEDVPDLDGTIRAALDMVQGHVYERLGLKAAAVKAAPAPVQEQKSAKPTKPAKPAPVQEQKAEAAEEAPAATEQPAELPAVTDGDLNKAIAQTMQRLTKAGVTNGGPRIIEKIKAYLPDGNPPFSPNRIPVTARRDFIKDLEELS